MIVVNENIYGHKSRLDFFKKYIDKEKLGVEFGAGTGVMLSSQLLQDGYNVYGVDLDCPSIELGQKIFKENGLSPERLKCVNLDTFPDDHFDYVIASEVFEHIYEKDIDAILELIKQKLKPEGTLLVTVPNGYGWFEFENIFWTTLKFRLFFRITLISQAFNFIRLKTGRNTCKYPSTIANSPHVRRFTMKSIKQLMEKHGFPVEHATGSVLFCGGFSNMFYSGIGFIMNFNKWLGKKMPKIASGFYLATINKK